MGELQSERETEVERALGPLFDAARMPIVVLRPEGGFVAANPAAIAKYGYSIAELRGMRVHDFIADQRDIDADLLKVAHGERLQLTRRPHRTKDGTIISVLPSAFGVNLLGSHYVVSFLQDVTSLDDAEEQTRRARGEAAELEVRARALRAELLAAERLATIGRVAAGIAHEVNNPAALVTLNLGIVRDRLKSGDVRTEEMLAMLDESLEAMARVKDIVHEVKGLGSERPREKVDLSRLAANAIRMVQRGAGSRADVDASFEPDVYAKVRGSRLSQVLTNLLINAAQSFPADDAGEDAAAEVSAPGEALAATPAAKVASRSSRPPGSRPQIALRTFREGDAACIEVSDTGPGVPSHLTERIFEPFFTTRAGSGGTGLGLWLARGIVEEEGGTIALSERPGGGAVFRVSLPAAWP